MKKKKKKYKKMVWVIKNIDAGKVMGYGRTVNAAWNDARKRHGEPEGMTFIDWATGEGWEERHIPANSSLLDGFEPLFEEVEEDDEKAEKGDPPRDQ